MSIDTETAETAERRDGPQGNAPLEQVILTLCQSSNGPGFGDRAGWLHWVPHTQVPIVNWQTEHPAICGWGGFKTTVSQWWSTPDLPIDIMGICPACNQMMNDLLNGTFIGERLP
jgi:hypothetical protein